MFTYSQGEEWKKLCELVANEQDPQEFAELLRQLIRALDARNGPTGDNGGSVKTTSGPVGREE
jgi:hypothetical protein